MKIFLKQNGRHKKRTILSVNGKDFAKVLTLCLREASAVSVDMILTMLTRPKALIQNFMIFVEQPQDYPASQKKFG